MERVVDSNVRRRVTGKIVTAYAKELAELCKKKSDSSFTSEGIDMEDFEGDIREMLDELADEIAILPNCN